MKFMALAAIAAVTTVAGAQMTSPAIDRALADPARADQAGDDARRQAAAVIAFAGVKPGDAVVDFLPGQGYWTRIFSSLVGTKGRVYAYWPAAAAKYAAKPLPALQARGLANVTAAVQATDLPTAAKPVDVFWTVQNYHDIPNGGPFGAGGEPALRAFDAAVFKLLKKGGIYLVIDHAGATGTGMTETNTKHRIEPAAVKAQVTAAGFRFVGESPVLRNPADDHSLKVFDPAIRGHTDQFVYKFRKP